jgi:hypothetical protein
MSISLLLRLEFSSEWLLLELVTGTLHMNGDKRGSGIDSCLFPLAPSFLPNIAGLPDQMLDFSDFHPHFRSKIKKCYTVKTNAGLRISAQQF